MSGKHLGDAHMQIQVSMDNQPPDDKALSIKQAAQMMGVSYGTIYKKRKKIGFKLPDGRKWYIWQSTLKNLYNGEGLFVEAGRNNICQSTKNMTNQIPTGGLILPHQTEQELDALLKQATVRKRKSITTV